VIEEEKRTAMSELAEEAKVQRKSIGDVEHEVKIEDVKWGYNQCGHRIHKFE
jgi:hypothetical protein